MSAIEQRPPATESRAGDTAARPPLRAWIASLASLDFTRPAVAAAFAVIYAASRLPWITHSYGTDPDAARVAISARWLWDHGEFYPSRLPGYPLFELIEAALYPLGATVMNTATLIVSFAGVILFAAILKRLQIEPKGLLTVAYAFAPMIWINSSITLDYLWGLTFVLGAYLLLLRESSTSKDHSDSLQSSGQAWNSSLWAGILLGIAIGCRPTSAMMALPFAVLLLRRRQLRPLVLFFAGMGVTAFIAFLPITLRYGLSFLSFFDVRPTWHRVARTLGVEAFGLTTALGLIVVLLLSWRRLLELPARLRRDVHLAVAVLAVLLLAMSFIRLPLEEAYLTPAVPFALIAVARLLRRPAVVAVCLLLMMGSLLDFHTTSEQGWRRPLDAIAGIRPVKGRVLVDHELRLHRLRVAADMRTLDLPPNSVVTAGFYYPIFVAEYQDDLAVTLTDGFRKKLIGPLADGSEARDARGVTYVWLMKPGDARNYRTDGYRTYTMDLDGDDVLVTFETYLPEHERFAER